VGDGDQKIDNGAITVRQGQRRKNQIQFTKEHVDEEFIWEGRDPLRGSSEQG